ncbi:MAG TPA: hypothetical protein VGM37_19385 [Armatimonadota bacterium]
MRNASYDTFLLAVFLGAVALQALFWRLGSGFRSAERKAGSYRAASGQGTSSKLPMTGGPAMALTAVLGGAWAFHHYWGGAAPWPVALAVAGFAVVGFLDDFGKFRGKGLSQHVKTLGCLAVSAAVAAALCARGASGVSPALAARWAAETAFLFCFSVAADFSDGIDGLAAGLGALCAMAMGLAALTVHRVGGAIWGLALVTILAFLPFNLPSAWTSRGTARRRARVYLGDSGALAMGGGMAAAALWLHMGWIFLPAAGVWLVEGWSSGWQAEFLVKRVYRRFGRVERYGADAAPHVEFPLPLLAAPIHHHFEMAGWDRIRVVSLFYAVAAVCAAGAVAAAREGPALAVGCGVAAAALAALWSLAGIYRTFYLAVGDAGALTLNSGLPFRLQSLRYHKVARVTGLSAADLTADERLWLYRPMPRPDASEMLVRLLAAHGRTEEAAAVAAGLPEAMRQMRLADVSLEVAP